MPTTRIIVAAITALTVSPLIAVAQSQSVSGVCAQACEVEYDRSLRQCAQNDEACVQNAALAYRTCVSTCPGAR